MNSTNSKSPNLILTLETIQQGYYSQPIVPDEYVSAYPIFKKECLEQIHDFMDFTSQTSTILGQVIKERRVEWNKHDKIQEFQLHSIDLNPALIKEFHKMCKSSHSLSGWIDWMFLKNLNVVNMIQLLIVYIQSKKMSHTQWTLEWTRFLTHYESLESFDFEKWKLLYILLQIY